MLNNLTVQNGQKIHVTFDHCENVQVSKIQVTAPEDTPNTDGIHVTHTQDIKISDSVIGTGSFSVMYLYNYFSSFLIDLD
ncbi:putative endo-polygalacturonase [Helianthus anomalus]